MHNEKAFYEIMETLEFGRAADEDTMSPCYARVYPDQMGYSAVGISLMSWGKDEDDAEQALVHCLKAALNEFAEEYGR